MPGEEPVFPRHHLTFSKQPRFRGPDGPIILSNSSCRAPAVVVLAVEQSAQETIVTASTTTITVVMSLEPAVMCRSAAIGCRSAALVCRSAALGSRSAALGCRSAALGSRSAALGCRSAALGCRFAALGCGSAAFRCGSAALGCRRTATVVLVVPVEQTGIRLVGADGTDHHRSSECQPFHSGLLLENFFRDEREELLVLFRERSSADTTGSPTLSCQIVKRCSCSSAL